MVQVLVKGNLPCRRIKRPGIFIDAGREKIADKSTKAWNNDAIVTEQQFPYKSFYVQNIMDSLITKEDYSGCLS
jgi:hypothetical protein